MQEIGTWNETLHHAPLMHAFINACTRPQILSLTIKSGNAYSIIDDVMINSALEESKKLISFTFKGLKKYLTYTPPPFTLKFPSSQGLLLQKVILGPIETLAPSTFEELRRHRNLTELSINTASHKELGQFLCSDHGLKFNLLNLCVPASFINDQTLNLATQHLKDLKEFTMYCYQSAYFIMSGEQSLLSDKGLLHLAKNCQKLHTLRLSVTNITDIGLDHFSLNSPQLEKIYLMDIDHITSRGLCSLAKNCPNLKALQLGSSTSAKVEVTCDLLVTLAEYCKNLQLLRLNFPMSLGVSPEDLISFFEQCTSLRYFSMLFLGQLSVGFFRARFPQVEFLSVDDAMFDRV